MYMHPDHIEFVLPDIEPEVKIQKLTVPLAHYQISCQTQCLYVYNSYKITASMVVG